MVKPIDVRFHFMSEHGKKPITQDEHRIAETIIKQVMHLAPAFGINRDFTVVICDEWAYLNHYKFHKDSVMHYQEGNKKIVGEKEAIFIRMSVLFHHKEDWREILKHELVHMKLKGKEGRWDEHGKLFQETARKEGLSKKYRKGVT
jgi:hypothetical protein